MKPSVKLILIISVLLLLIVPSPVQAQNPPTQFVVRAVLFWMDGCPHCHEVLDNILPPLQAQYGEQLQITLIEVTSLDDIDLLYEVAARYDISKEQVGVPLLIIGEQVLIGSDQIPAELPELIERSLKDGDVPLPDIPEFATFLSAEETLETALESGGAERQQMPAHADMVENPESSQHQILSNGEMKNNGFTLAIVIMGLMAATLIYSLISFQTEKTFSLPGWSEWLTPTLIVIGIGVAGYLSYVETQTVAAICGPVGDCNAVQTSPHARLFGVFPVGVLGLLGYLALLASWLTCHFFPRLAKPAALAFWGMAVLAVIFSIYLTYLEPFVIKAVCIWCLTSAVIVTLLLLLGTPPAVQHFSISDEDK